MPSAASIAEYRAKVEALYKVHNPTKMVREPTPPPPSSGLILGAFPIVPKIDGNFEKKN